MEEQLKQINEDIRKTETELAEKKKKLEEIEKKAKEEKSEKNKLREWENVKINKYASIFKKRNVRIRYACPVCKSECAIPEQEKNHYCSNSQYYCERHGCPHYYYTEDCAGGQSERAKSSNKPLYNGELEKKVFWD